MLNKIVIRHVFMFVVTAELLLVFGKLFVTV